MMKIFEIADIISGINYNRTNQFDNGNSIPLLQAKDFNAQGLLKNNIVKINKSIVNNKLHISQSDVLFAAKGSRNYSVVYKNEVGVATAASTFFILRVKSDLIIPEYLSWYLNQKPAQEYIKQQSVGAYIPSINKVQLGELNIPVPTIELQKKIIKINELRKKEKELLNTISSKRDLLIENILYKIIQES